MPNKSTTVQRQRAEFRAINESSPAALERRRLLLAWLAERRPRDTAAGPGQYGPGKGCDCSCEPGLPPIELLDWRGDGEMLPVVAGQCVVRVEPGQDDVFEKLARTLKSKGWSADGEPDGDQATLITFTAKGADADLKTALGIAEGYELRAGVNHIVPLNWSVKGKIGPETACEELPLLDPKDEPGALLHAIDTGLASVADRDRTDGRLATASGDLDRLDEVDRYGTLAPDGCLDIGAGHGTSVAGVAECVEPGLRVKVHRALGPDGVGTEDLIAEKIVEVGKWVIEHGGGVVNLSFGTQSYDDMPPLFLEAAFEQLGLGDEKGRAGSRLCFVAAAGNWGDDKQQSWPAALPGVIAVAALDEEGKPAEWSSRGRWVDFSAQGEGIVAPYVVGKETPGTPDPGDPYDPYPDRWDGPNPNALWMGTSFASPQVAAKLADFLYENPEAACGDAVKWLCETADEGYQDAGFGYGLPHLWSNCTNDKKAG